MRVSILTVGSRGDVQPFVAFGIGLQRAGHHVRVCTHSEFAELVTDQGLDFAALATGDLSRGPETEEGRRWAERQSRWMPTWVGLIRDARSVATERMCDAAHGCRDADAIVATNLTQVLGWQFARERGVPIVRALLNAPGYWMSRRTNRPVAAGIRQGAWLAARPWLNRVRREALELPPLPLREPIGRLDRERQLVLYPFSRAVFPKPAGWGDWTEVTGYWFLDARVDPEPPDDLRSFLEAGPRPVCMGFGTQLDDNPVATTRAMIEALRGAGWRGVLLRGPGALDGVKLGDDIVRAPARLSRLAVSALRGGGPPRGGGHNRHRSPQRNSVGHGPAQRRPVHVGAAAGGARRQPATDTPPEALARAARAGGDRRHDIRPAARAGAGPRGAHP